MLGKEATKAPTSEEVDEWARIVTMKGYHIVPNVVPIDFITQIKAHYLEIFNAHTQSNKANRGDKRWQMCVPLEAPFLDDKLIANPIFLPVLKKLLGKDCILALYSSHVALPGCRVQQVHIDYPPLFDNYMPLPPYCIYVHIPLVDLTEQNGPTEYWPGSPHMAIHTTINSISQFDKLPLGTLPTEKPLVKAGGAIIKDMRCFHRGTPNESEEIRPILSLIYARQWYRLPHEPLYIEQGYPAMSIPQKVYNQLPHTTRSLLRFSKIIEDQPSDSEGSEPKSE